MSNEQSLAHFYRAFYMTRLLESDIKNLKRINNIYSKYLKTGKQSYMLEIVNILRILNNNMFIIDAKYILLDYIEDQYKSSVSILIDNLEECDKILLSEMICTF